MNPADVALAVLIAGAVYTDITTKKIRNVHTFPVMALGIAMAPYTQPRWFDGALGLLAAMALAIPAWRLGRALHAGDVKMLMAAGALLGPEAAIRAVLFTYIIGFPAGIAVLAYRGRLGNLYRMFVKREKVEPTEAIHAPVVAAGILVARLQPWPNLW
ncbi:MAG: prepilin peptidase [Deltaproteobacteria bacterium]|nr:prepilin peptidase [Deltaproteobacteria bacterium]